MSGPRYFEDLAAAFVRGKLGLSGEPEALIEEGLAQGIKLHKFKRQAELPRVRRVLGILKGLAPSELLDVGSGRGTFLWPMLAAFPGLPVLAVDLLERRAVDLQAVRRGGVPRLHVSRMDAARLGLRDGSLDVVTALEVLEHLRRPELAAAELVRVARRCIVCSVPSHKDDNPEHVQLFDERSFSRLFLEAGASRVSCEHVLNHLIAVVRP